MLQFCLVTDNRGDGDGDIHCESDSGTDEEVGYRVYQNDNGGDDGGCDELDCHNGVDLPDECPPELRRVEHHRVEKRRSRFEVFGH